VDEIKWVFGSMIQARYSRRFRFLNFFM
jgi:hypothetical protein